MKKKLICLSVFCSVVSAVFAGVDWKDYTLGALKFLYVRSDLIVEAKIVSKPTKHHTEIGPFQYNCEVEIARVLKGDKSLTGKKIEVGLVRVENSTEDQHPLIKNNTECMLFLKHELGDGFVKWISADLWLAIQPSNSAMAEALEHLSQTEKNKTVEQDASHGPGKAEASPDK